MVLKFYSSTKKLTCFLLFFLIFRTSYAQFFNKDLSNIYPKNIIVKVYDIYSKIKVDTITQRKIADLLYKQEDSLFLFITQNKKENFINNKKLKFYNQQMDLINVKDQILYSIELSKERSRTKFNYSTFLLALQNIDSLRLRNIQIDSLVECIIYLKQLKDSTLNISNTSWLDTKEFESKNLFNILNSIQYKKLLDIKNLDKSIASAKNDWEEIEERKLTNGLVKNEELQKLKIYYLERNNIYDQFAHDNKTKSQMLSILYNQKPRVLTILIKARRSPNNDTLQKNLTW